MKQDVYDQGAGTTTARRAGAAPSNAEQQEMMRKMEEAGRPGPGALPLGLSPGLRGRLAPQRHRVSPVPGGLGPRVGVVRSPVPGGLGPRLGGVRSWMRIRALSSYFSRSAVGPHASGVPL